MAGISVNFACLSGQLPSQELFRQAEDVLAACAPTCAAEPVLSLGGTCAVQHLDGYRPRFATEIRSGGGPMYGYDFVSGCGIAGLDRVDPVLTASVLECFRKPPAPEGPGGLDAFGHVPDVDLPDEDAWYGMVALGRRDMEPGGLRPLIDGAYLAGATSDVCILITPEALRPGDEVRFAADYEALVRAVTSPYVSGRVRARRPGAAAERSRMTTHADARYVGRRRPLKVLADADVERIHEAALDVLADDRRHGPQRPRPGRARGARRHRRPRDDRGPHPRERGRGGARHPARRLHPGRPRPGPRPPHRRRARLPHLRRLRHAWCATPTARCA